MRGAVAAYFEQEPGSASDTEARAAAVEGLPLAAASRFLATDVRMLLRETAAKQVRSAHVMTHLPLHVLGRIYI